MATTVHTDFQIYDDEVQTGFNETLVQETDAFNAASNGAIVMRPNPSEGYYAREAFFKAISSLNSRRDITDDFSSAATALKLTESQMVLVKLFRKIGPVDMSRGAFKTIMRNPGEASVLIGQQAAKATAIDMVNSGLRAAVAALSGVAAVVHDVTAASPADTISTDNLVQTLAKAGDSASDVVLWVMHSTAYYKLIRDQISNQQYLDSVAGVNIATATPVTLGRPVLVTDATPLYGGASATDPIKVLGLRRGAIRLEDSELQEMIVDDITGFEQLGIRVQGEYAFNVGVMGFQYTVAGSPVGEDRNPTDATLGASAMWSQVATSHKSLGGVLLIADPS